MTTITLKINEKSTIGKTFIAFLKSISTKEKDIQLIPESPYNPKFVEKIKKAEKRADYIEVNPNDIWGSLGLK